MAINTKSESVRKCDSKLYWKILLRLCINDVAKLKKMCGPLGIKIEPLAELLKK